MFYIAVVLTGACSADADCAEGGVTNAVCNSGTCACDTGYTANSGNTACDCK